jgi:uncharacterized RDD family membrane protein YckC
MNKTKPQTYYDLLKVSFYASEDELRRGCESALRRAENVGFGIEPTAAERESIAEKRKQIMQAYAMLKDPARRAKYNAAISAKLAQTSDAASSPASPDAKQTDDESSRSGTSDSAAPLALNGIGQAATPYAPIVAKPEVVDVLASLQSREALGKPLGNSLDGTYSVDRDFAHLGVRFTAMMIDVFIVGTLLPFAVFLLVPSIPDNNLKQTSFGAIFLVGVFAAIVQALVLACYYVFGESGKHRSTWGKRWMGLQVVRTIESDRLGILRAFGRFILRGVGVTFLLFGIFHIALRGASVLLYPFGVLPPLISHGLAFFTGRKQTLYDLMTDTVVVQVKEPPKYWPVLCIGLLMFTLVSFTVAQRAVKSDAADELSPALEAAMSANEKFNRKGLRPQQSEVESAYDTALSLQRSLTTHLANYAQWPNTAEGSEIIKASAQYETLRKFDVILLEDGSFVLSMGATPYPYGRARLVFVPNASLTRPEWRCISIEVSDDQSVPQCKPRK